MHLDRTLVGLCTITTLLLSASLLPLAGCGDDDGATPQVCGDVVSGAGTLKDFQPPCDPGAKGVLFSASGEVLALTGYDFPPASPDDVAFVDGWEIRYDRVLVTFDHIRLNDNPDKSPTDESQMDGVVAGADGPWAVDLHKGGSLVGKGGGDEQAVPIVALTGKNMGASGSFDPTARYAFSFETIPATADAQNVNLDAADLTDYQEMISKGYTAMLVGTATWKGDASCTSTIAGYDFSQLPTTVHMRLGFHTPTSYLNCQNPENDPAAALGTEEHQRGLHVLDNTSTIAQCTFHLDHAFWESFVHDSPAHFDQYAAHYVGMTAPTATLDDFTGVSFQPFTDGNGVDLPWRSCLADYTPPTAGAMTFDTLSVAVDPSGQPATAIRDFVDYTDYNQSTFGHLNSDGLCFVKHNYPSPQ